MNYKEQYKNPEKQKRELEAQSCERYLQMEYDDLFRTLGLGEKRIKDVFPNIGKDK